MRDAAEEAKEASRRTERERLLERDAERTREREREREHRSALSRNAAASAAPPPLGTPPSLQRHLPQPVLNAAATHPPAHQPSATQHAQDELSRSDIWNFSAGAVARKSNCAPPPPPLPPPPLLPPPPPPPLRLPPPLLLLPPPPPPLLLPLLPLPPPPPHTPRPALITRRLLVLSTMARLAPRSVWHICLRSSHFPH